MVELHVLRACMAVRDGRASVDDAGTDESDETTHSRRRGAMKHPPAGLVRQDVVADKLGKYGRGR